MMGTTEGREAQPVAGEEAGPVQHLLAPGFHPCGRMAQVALGEVGRAGLRRTRYISKGRPLRPKTIAPMAPISAPSRAPRHPVTGGGIGEDGHDSVAVVAGSRTRA